MGQSPDDIRRDIEETRSDMTETAQAIGHRADVPGRVKGAVREKRDEWFGSSGGSDSQDQAKRQAGRLKSMAEDNPLGLAVGGFAVGFLAGLVLPPSDFESEHMGPVASDARERAMEAGEEAYERGKDVARDAAESAKDTAEHRGREEAEQMRGSEQSETGGTAAASPADVQQSNPESEKRW